MNWAHIHLLLNHIPVIGIMLGALLSLFAILRKSEELKRVTLGIFVFTAVIALPVYFTGEPAEDMVKHLPEVSKAFIEPHEDSALFSLVAAIVTGIVALIGLIVYRRAEKLPNWIATSTLVLSLVASGLMGWTANLGGQIRHTEIRAGFTPSAETQTGSNQGEAEGQQKAEKEKAERGRKRSQVSHT
ncbi:MAG: hypothetical protein J2P31_21250 [Blastocatellia bacterium]|nr:hypothetical protein [Blastocatellia bacterium]